MLEVWAAGFFDGEGHVSAQRRFRHGQTRWTLRVSVSQKDRRPLERLQEGYGGAIRAQKGGMWSWELGPRAGARFLHSIRPYLWVKGEQADVALALAERMRQGVPTTDAENETRKRLAAQLSALKRVA